MHDEHTHWDDFRAKVRIEDHISRFEELKSEGNYLFGTHGHDSKGGRCLSVDVDKQVFYCFQCARGGTVITYEQMRLNESSAMEAAQSLASIYSIKTPLPDETDDQRTRRLNFSEERKIAVSIIGKAFDLYHSNMTDEQRDYFRGRGVNDATIDELKLGYAPPGGRWLVERIYEFFKNKEQLLSSGLFFEDKQGKLRDRYIDRYLIPYWHRNDIVFSVGRSIDPEVEKTKKYVKHLTNSERYPFVSKTLYQIMWNEESIKHRAKILVVEGAIDAVLAKERFEKEYQVISPMTTAWSNNQLDRLIERTAKCKDITFVCDSEENNAGESGAIRTAKKIRLKWRKMLDEQTNDDQAPKVFNEAHGNAYMPALKVARLRRPSNVAKLDLADYVCLGREKELRYWIESAQSLEYNEKRLDGNPGRFFLSKNYGNFSPKILADEIMLDSQYFLYVADHMWHFKGGVYTANGENYIHATAQRMMKERSNTNRKREVVNYLETFAFQDTGDVNNVTNTLNCKNGIYDGGTGELLPHDPYMLSTIQVPVNYDSKATCPSIEKFISEVVPDDCCDLMAEIAGYCFLQDTPFQKAFMFTGEGANGKGTMIRLLQTLLGEDNVSNVPIQELDENRFKRAEMFGKLGNFFADLSASTIKNSSYFKMAVAGDKIDAERKHRDPFFFKPFATLVFSANSIPASYDRTHAFYRRWEIIPFPNRFENSDDNVNLIDEITTEQELSVFLNLALDGLIRVHDNNGFSPSESSEGMMQSYKADNDNIVSFVEECVETLEDHEIPRTAVYKAYRSYCENSAGTKPASQRKFNSRIEELVPQIEKTRAINNDRQHVWRNISLVYEDDQQDYQM